MIEALKQALEALEVATTPLARDRQEVLRAQTALRQAIEQAEKQEPVFWYRPVGEDGGYEGPLHNGVIEKVRKECGAWKPLYTTPQPQREWVGLMRGVRVDGDTVVITVKGGNEAARKLCAELLKEKNT